MLASVALLVVGRGGTWLPSFAVLLGLWDVFFYVFLKLWTGWPGSLLTWDLLFLIPVPWVGPVLAPVLVSLALIVCGVVALCRRVHFRAVHWVGYILANLIILYSFMADYQYVLAGNLPRSFGWPVFAGGLLLGVGAFVHAFLAGAKLPGTSEIPGELATGAAAKGSQGYYLPRRRR
jgi:hypothetical protein